MADGDITPVGEGDGDSSTTSDGDGSPDSAHSTGGGSSDTSSPIDAGSSSTRRQEDTSFLTGGGENGLSVNSSSTRSGNSLSSEIEALYERRYEEGYDTFDPNHAHWLNQHHPEALGKYFTSPTVSNSKASTLQSTYPSDTVSTSSSLTSKSNTRSLQSTPLSDGNSATSTLNPKSGTQLTTLNSDQSKNLTSSNSGSIVSKFLGGVPVKIPSRG